MVTCFSVCSSSSLNHNLIYALGILEVCQLVRSTSNVEDAFDGRPCFSKPQRARFMATPMCSLRRYCA